MEEYIRILLEQIRCKKARPMIEQEIRSHIEDQAEANRAAGMTPAVALSAAVKDMGNPVEAGISLDRIHRPRFSRKLLFIMICISLLNILIHITIGLHEDMLNGYTGEAYIRRIILHVFLGFGVMLLCCHLDYSFFARFARPLLALLYLFLFWQSTFGGLMINGAMRFAALGPTTISLVHLSFLCVPLYGSLLFQYYGTGYRGIAKSILWMLPPVISCRNMPCLSQGILLFFLLSLLLSLAVYQGVFRVNRKKFLILYWSVLLLVPLLFLFSALTFDGLLATYQTARIKAFFLPGNSDWNYIGNLLRQYLSQAKLLGTSGLPFGGYLPEYNSSYILTCICSYYGIAAGIVICLLLLSAGLHTLRFSLRQGNLPGRMMGLGCSLVFLSCTFVNILENLGLLPLTQTFLPFFSYGGSGTLISYILMGIAFSVYRFQNILPPSRVEKSVP